MSAQKLAVLEAQLRHLFMTYGVTKNGIIPLKDAGWNEGTTVSLHPYLDQVNNYGITQLWVTGEVRYIIDVGISRVDSSKMYVNIKKYSNTSEVRAVQQDYRADFKGGKMVDYQTNGLPKYTRHKKVFKEAMQYSAVMMKVTESAYKAAGVGR